jgi:hypothetical protein
VANKRKDALRDSIVGLLAKKPARLVTVALANKLARIIWAMMATGKSFRLETFARVLNERLQLQEFFGGNFTDRSLVSANDVMNDIGYYV